MKLRNLSWILVILAPGALGAAETPRTKVSGTLQCAKPNPQYSVEVGDEPGHLLTLSKATCTWTKPMELGGQQTKEGTSANTDEVEGTKAEAHGLHTSTMANGEKIFVKYEGEATLKDGAPQSTQGRWRFKGGTGSFKRLHGKGTYAGTPGADGSMTFAIEGEYELEPPRHTTPKK